MPHTPALHLALPLHKNAVADFSATYLDIQHSLFHVSSHEIVGSTRDQFRVQHQEEASKRTGGNIKTLGSKMQRKEEMQGGAESGRTLGW